LSVVIVSFLDIPTFLAEEIGAKKSPGFAGGYYVDFRLLANNFSTKAFPASG